MSVDWGLLFDEGLLIVIATLLLFKWVVLRRRTSLGRALAWNNLAMAIAYYGAFLALHVPFFRGSGWRWSVRVLVCLTATHAILEVVRFFGGWPATGRELRLSMQEMRDGWRSVVWRLIHRRQRRAWPSSDG